MGLCAVGSMWVLCVRTATLVGGCAVAAPDVELVICQPADDERAAREKRREEKRREEKREKRAAAYRRPARAR